MTYFSSISRWKLFPALPSCINCSVKKVRKKVERELKGKTEMKFSMSDSLAHTSGKVQKKSRASSSLVVDLAQLFEGATEKSKMFCKMQRWKKKFRSFPTQADLSVRAEKSPFFYASDDEFRMNFYVADSFLSDILYRDEKCICIDILPPSSSTMFYCLFIMGETSTPCEWWEHLRIL